MKGTSVISFPGRPPQPLFPPPAQDALSWLLRALSSAIPSNRKIRRQFGQTFFIPPIVARQCGQVRPELPGSRSHRISLLKRLPLSIVSPECVRDPTSPLIPNAVPTCYGQSLIRILQRLFNDRFPWPRPFGVNSWNGTNRPSDAGRSGYPVRPHQCRGI